MPRIYSSCSDPWDFCKRCFPSFDVAQKRYGLEQEGEGPDGRGDCFSYDDDHPCYSDTDYKCEGCGKLLEDWDN